MEVLPFLLCALRRSQMELKLQGRMCWCIQCVYTIMWTKQDVLLTSVVHPPIDMIRFLVCVSDIEVGLKLQGIMCACVYV